MILSTLIETLLKLMLDDSLINFHLPVLPLKAVTKPTQKNWSEFTLFSDKIIEIVNVFIKDCLSHKTLIILKILTDISMTDFLQQNIVNELHGGSIATKRTAENIEAAQQKVDNLKMKLDKHKNQNAPDDMAPGDWTRIYSVSDGYEDTQDLEVAVEEESKRLQDLSENALLSAHQHDHADVS